MPDLFGLDFDILSEPLAAGDTFNLEYEIGNTGSIANGPFRVSFYLSKNNIIDPSAGFDILLGSDTITGRIGSNASTGTFTTSLTLPGINAPFWQTNSGDGTYHIGMVIDSLNQVAESNETNNSNRGFLLDWDDIVINNTLRADLVATSANVVLEPQTAGSTFDFDYNISNIGGAATGNYTVSFYLSSNDIITTADKSLGSVSLSSLAAGATTGTLTTRLMMPGVNDAFWLANGGNGDYTVGMILDSANTVTESNEGNNSNQGQLIDFDTLVVNGTTAADLVGSSSNVVQEPLTAGATFDFDYVVSNLGGISTGQATKVSFYLSSNATISSTDYLLGEATIGNLAAGASTAALSKRLTLPQPGDPFWTGDGTYNIGIIVDSDNVVAEANETNNRNQGNLIDRDAVVITGTEKADLLATLGNVILEPQNAGSTFTFEFDISNQGGVATGAFDVQFYLSSNSTISTSDQLLGTTTLSSLSANSSTGTLTVDLTLPGINDSFWQGNGTYYVGTVIDPSNAVDESNETNNRNRGLLLDYDDLVVNNTAQTGQRGNDDFIGTDAADFFQGLRGDDDIFGNGGNDTLRGGRGDDDIVGGRGSDILNGDRGDDFLVGVDITNTVNPGSNQVDRLTGGLGDDTFFLGNSNQSYYTDTTSTDYAIITDYTAGEDLIVLYGSASSYSLSTPAAGLPTGTGIFRGSELVAIVQGDTAALSLTGGAFSYL